MAPYRKCQLSFVGVVCLLLFCVQTTLSITWLSMAKDRHASWNRTRDCTAARKSHVGFKKEDVAFCKHHVELMPAVAQAARQAVASCQHLFGDMRWNCSSVLLAPALTNDLVKGSREQAFVYALSAAVLVQTVSRACSMGASHRCGCSQLPNEAPSADFQWGGCGDDVTFGIDFSRSFADARWLKRKKASELSLVNLHNSEVGRKVAQQSLRTDCKCHGVSGACNLKTCWKALSDVPAVAAELQQRHAVAVEVRMRTERGARRLAAANQYRPTFGPDDLVYNTLSPDYCYPDKASGSVGTKNRECAKNDPGPGGCHQMCCGRGYVTEQVQVQYRCDCKYYWCCYVKCKICTKVVEVNRCK